MVLGWMLKNGHRESDGMGDRQGGPLCNILEVASLSDHQGISLTHFKGGR